MDAQKMGAFIAQCRKEKQMTQEQLAQRLQVTDKAVSRWETGVGFPDITTIEPLAQALGVEVLELMHAQRLKKPDNSNSETEQAVHDILQLAQEQRRQERKKIALLLAGVLTALLLLLVLDVLDWQWEAILFTGLGVILPLFCAGGVPVLLLYGAYRKARGKSVRFCFAAALGFCLLLLLFVGGLFLIGALGLGPVPN